MEENKDNCIDKAKSRTRVFFDDLIAGICIGVAFIIPGFSGGSVAAILGVYEKLINAIANIFKEIKKSIITLLPIGVGMLVGIGALLFPIAYMLDRYPLQTVSLFIGLALGGIPALTDKIKGNPTSNEIITLSVPLAVTICISFIPGGADVNLFGLKFSGYLLLFLIGIIGSIALVVPGISGSMILLILGYYNPLVNLLTEHLLKLRHVPSCVLVLMVFGVGAAIGFFLISMLMKTLFAKFPRGTYFSIIGFIIGSIPVVYVSTMKSAGMISQSFAPISLPTSPFVYVICLFLIVMGVSISNGFTNVASKKAD